MYVSLLVPGFECKVTDAGIASRVVGELVEHIYYEAKEDVVSVHKQDENPSMLIRVGEGGLYINQDFYCLPDAITVITNYICNLLC